MAQPRIQRGLKPDSSADAASQGDSAGDPHIPSKCVSHILLFLFFISLFPSFHLIPNVSCFEISVRHNTLKKYNSNISENK